MGGWGSGWRGVKKETIERCLMLSVSDLARIGALTPGCKAGSLRWGERGKDHYAALEYSSSIQADGTGELWLRYKTQGDSIHDCVSLIFTVPHYGGRRWWFKCPFQQIRVAKLYLPPGATRFASRQVWDAITGTGLQFCDSAGLSLTGALAISLVHWSLNTT
jgi:hypothetical protein